MRLTNRIICQSLQVLIIFFHSNGYNLGADWPSITIRHVGGFKKLPPLLTDVPFTRILVTRSRFFFFFLVVYHIADQSQCISGPTKHACKRYNEFVPRSYFFDSSNEIDRSTKNVHVWSTSLGSGISCFGLLKPSNDSKNI